MLLIDFLSPILSTTSVKFYSAVCIHLCNNCALQSKAILIGWLMIMVDNIDWSFAKSSQSSFGRIAWRAKRTSAWEATLAFAAFLQQFSFLAAYWDGFRSFTDYWYTILGDTWQLSKNDNNSNRRRRSRRTALSTNILLNYCDPAVNITLYTWNINNYR